MVKNPAVLAGDERSIPGSGRCWRKNWQPTPLSCLENLTVYRVTESRTQVSMHTRIRCKVTGSILISAFLHMVIIQCTFTLTEQKSVGRKRVG